MVLEEIQFVTHCPDAHSRMVLNAVFGDRFRDTALSYSISRGIVDLTDPQIRSKDLTGSRRCHAFGEDSRSSISGQIVMDFFLAVPFSNC